MLPDLNTLLTDLASLKVSTTTDSQRQEDLIKNLQTEITTCKTQLNLYKEELNGLKTTMDKLAPAEDVTNLTMDLKMVKDNIYKVIKYYPAFNALIYQWNQDNFYLNTKLYNKVALTESEREKVEKFCGFIAEYFNSRDFYDLDEESICDAYLTE